MSTPNEPRNPLYLLLLLVSLAFVATALAYAVVPVLEQKATEAGNPPPPSPFREGLREHGAALLLGLAAAIVVLSLLSMAVDRLRALKKQRAAGTMPPPNPTSPLAPRGRGAGGEGDEEKSPSPPAPLPGVPGRGE